MVLVGSRVRKTVRVIWIIVCTAAVATVPICAWELDKQDYELYAVAWFVAGAFVAMAVPMSIWAIAQHLESYTEPRIQRYIVRILLMVPIYALNSWFALRYKDIAFYLNTPREAYEAFVVYSFYQFLIAYLEKKEGHVDVLMASKPPVGHIWPLNYFLRQWKMGAPFLRRCRGGILNYVVLRPLTTFVAIVTKLSGVYGQHTADPRKAYLYCVIVNNVSQCVALYCLIMFYKACVDELRPIRPFSKFMCVKGVVFFSFWQWMVILLLVRLRIITAHRALNEYDPDDFATGLQDFLICIEMFVAALAHAYAFSPKDYRTEGSPSRSLMRSITDMFDVRDVYQDVKEESERLNARGRAAKVRCLACLGLASREDLPREEDEEEVELVDMSERTKLLESQGRRSREMTEGLQGVDRGEDALTPLACSAERLSSSDAV